MDKQLRIVAGAIVTESKLSKGAKLQLLNFIQTEASDVQVKALLLDGKILPKISPLEEQVINDRFENLNEGMAANLIAIFLKSLSDHATMIASYGFGQWVKAFPDYVKLAYQSGNMAGAWMGVKGLGAANAAAAAAPPLIAGGVLATLILLMARKAWKSYGTKVNRECAKAPDVEKCKMEAKQKILKQKIADLQKAKSFCKKSKNPQKCTTKLDKKISALKAK